MLIRNEKCDFCGTCVAVCPTDSLILSENDLHINHETCTLCGLCVKMCPMNALEINDED